MEHTWMVDSEQKHGTHYSRHLNNHKELEGDDGTEMILSVSTIV